MPSGAPGKDAALHMVFEPRAGRTELVRLDRRAPLLVQQALHWDEAMPELACVYVLSTSGGIVQGDRYRIDIRLRPGARAHVGTQSATRIQEMDTNYASQTQRIVLDAGTYLEYLPEPTIPYRHSRFLSDVEVVVHPDATLLYAEVLAPGRIRYGDGEVFGYDLFSSRLHAARPDGTDLFVEKYLIEPYRHNVRRAGLMNGFLLLANVAVLAPPDVAESVAEAVPAAAADGRAVLGVSRLPHDAGLMCRVLATGTEPVRAAVRTVWQAVRRAAVDAAVPRPFPWR